MDAAMFSVTIYKGDSTRRNSWQSKQPQDIGKFRPRVLQHTLRPYQVETETGTRWACQNDTGSLLLAADSPEEAFENGLQWAKFQGWTQDRALAEHQAIQHASARKNAHPRR